MHVYAACVPLLIALELVSILESYFQFYIDQGVLFLFFSYPVLEPTSTPFLIELRYVWEVYYKILDIYAVNIPNLTQLFLQMKK